MIACVCGDEWARGRVKAVTMTTTGVIAASGVRENPSRGSARAPLWFGRAVELDEAM